MRQLSPRAVARLKLPLFVLCLLPLGLTVWQLFFGGLGANPVEAMLHRAGEWALRLLLITLAVTPLRRLTGANWLVRLRRMLGLFAFFYVCLHLAIFLVFEHSLDPAAVWEDVVERPYILVGVLAFVLLLPLAVTSTKSWMRRLGRRWQQLHRLVYAAAVLAVVHYALLVKTDLLREPAVYAALLALLLGLRVWHASRARRRPARAH